MHAVHGEGKIKVCLGEDHQPHAQREDAEEKADPYPGNGYQPEDELKQGFYAGN